MRSFFFHRTVFRCFLLKHTQKNLCCGCDVLLCGTHDPWWTGAVGDSCDNGLDGEGWGEQGEESKKGARRRNESLEEKGGIKDAGRSHTKLKERQNILGNTYNVFSFLSQGTKIYSARCRGWHFFGPMWPHHRRKMNGLAGSRH